MLVKKTNKNLPMPKAIAIIIAIILYGAAAYGAYVFLGNMLENQAIEHQKQTELATKSAIKAIADAKEAKRKEPVIITLPGAAPLRAIVEDYTLQSSIWAIVNKTYSISTDYIPEPLIIPDVATRTDKSNDERSVRADIAPSVVELFATAKTNGYELMIGSGYRSAALQSIYFYSLANAVGESQANVSIARPGESEHQTGLAIDISTVSYECYLDNCFADTDGGQWLANNAYKYGFILRYPEDKTAITGYMYESWHFRYVGVDLATALHQSDLTLEEAWPYLEQAGATLRTNGAI